MVSEKSSANAPITSVEGPRRAQTGFRESAGQSPGWEKPAGYLRGRSAGVKMEMSVDASTRRPPERELARDEMLEDITLYHRDKKSLFPAKEDAS